MTVTARKYNPGFLSDDDLVASFCVRTDEFASMLETLRESSGQANTHQIVIGPRGSGKTSLLLRVAAEIRRDDGLSVRFFPVVFAEESYEVSTAGEFWLECLSRLADQAPRAEDGPDLHRTHEELRQIEDDRTLGDRCLGVLQDFADRHGKRLVLVVENLNMLFGDIGDPETGWQLRHTLQTDPRFLLLASATSRFDEIDKQDRAFYDLFRVLTLRPLDTDGCAALWRAVSGQDRAARSIQALRILTGGSPRLLTIVARFGGELSFRELMADLLTLVDDHTEYFKSHLDALPPQERRVYLALAELWKPATTREIAERARLDTSKCSAHLARLTERGAVEVTGGSPRRKLYYLAERLYNIYYLMRRARGPTPMIEALIRFMAGWYSPDELKAFGSRLAREAAGLDGDSLGVYRIAFEQLVRLPSLEPHREDLLSTAPPTLSDRIGGFSAVSAAPSAAKTLSGKAWKLIERGRLQEAVDAWDELVRHFGTSEAQADLEQVALALVNKGTALDRLQRPEEALAVWNEVVQRFGANDGKALPQAAATALLNKGRMLGDLGRHTEALVALNEVKARSGTSRDPALRASVANASVGRAVTLVSLGRPREALESCDEVVRRFGGSEEPALLRVIAAAMVGRGHALLALNDANEAVAAWGEVIERFGNSKSPPVLEQVASALANIGAALIQLGRVEESLATLETVEQRYMSSDIPMLREIVARSLVNKGNVLSALNREAEALASWEEAIRRYRAIEFPAEADSFASALMNTAATLLRDDRKEEALAALAEVAERFAASDRPELLAMVANALKYSGALLERLGRLEEALAVWVQVEERFGASEAPEFIETVAKSFLNISANLFDLNRPDEALAACDRAVKRFENSSAPEVLDAVAGVLVNKGVVLLQSNRNEEALAVWSDIVQRLENSDTPGLQKWVATALVRKGATLFGLNRPEEAVAAWNEVVRRFGARDQKLYGEEIARSLLDKVVVLDSLDRLDEAIAVCNEVLERFEGLDEPYAIEVVAEALINKGTLLVHLDRIEDALEVWNVVVDRYEASESPTLRNAAEVALYESADYELESGRPTKARELVDRAFRSEKTGFPVTRVHCHLIRALAHLAEREDAACARDIESALAILSALNPLPQDALNGLIALAVDLGPEKIRDLILASPAADLLLPLTTALEKDMGLAPRVAKEVEEVAEDILRNMAERRGRGDA